MGASYPGSTRRDEPTSIYRDAPGANRPMCRAPPRVVVSSDARGDARILDLSWYSRREPGDVSRAPRVVVPLHARGDARDLHLSWCSRRDRYDAAKVTRLSDRK